MLPQDFSMAFHLFILNLRQILFLKVKSTQFTQLFLAMLDRFIELFYELFIAPRSSLGIPMIVEDNDSFSHFCCATANPGSSKSLTGLSRETRNEPVFSSGQLSVLKCWKHSENQYGLLQWRQNILLQVLNFIIIYCITPIWHNFLYLCFPGLKKATPTKADKRSSEQRKEQQGGNCCWLFWKYPSPNLLITHSVDHL